MEALARPESNYKAAAQASQALAVQGAGSGPRTHNVRMCASAGTHMRNPAARHCLRPAQRHTTLLPTAGATRFIRRLTCAYVAGLTRTPGLAPSHLQRCRSSSPQPLR